MPGEASNGDVGRNSELLGAEMSVGCEVKVLLCCRNGHVDGCGGWLKSDTFLVRNITLGFRNVAPGTM